MVAEQVKKELEEGQGLSPDGVEEWKARAECGCRRLGACPGASPPGDEQDPQPAPEKGAATITPRDEFRD